MANVLTTGAWLSAPTKKPSFFIRLLRAHAESNRQRATRVVEQYVADHGLQRLSDDAERQISHLIVKAGKLIMLTLIIIHVAHKLARFGNGVRETWHETQRLRRSLAGPMDRVAERVPSLNVRGHVPGLSRL